LARHEALLGVEGYELARAQDERARNVQDVERPAAVAHRLPAQSLEIFRQLQPVDLRMVVKPAASPVFEQVNLPVGIGGR